MVYQRQWSPEEDAMLGTDSDGMIARKIGASPPTVRKRREKLGIPKYANTPTTGKRLRLLRDPEMNAKLDELKPFLAQEFTRRGVPVRSVDDQTAVLFLLDQALSAFKKAKTRSLYSKDET